MKNCWVRTTDGADEEVKLKHRIWIETKKMWKVAAPAIFSTSGVTVISLAFIVHIGATELAAYALVSTVLLRFSNGILRDALQDSLTFWDGNCLRTRKLAQKRCFSNWKVGMASALETLCGQSYGANRYDMLGVYLQRSWLILFLWTCARAMLVRGSSVGGISVGWVYQLYLYVKSCIYLLFSLLHVIRVMYSADLSLSLVCVSIP